MEHDHMIKALTPNRSNHPLYTHVFADAALTDVDAELEQFTVQAWCTASGILPAHLADQISDLARNERSSGLAAPHLPGPEQSKCGTMPSYDRFWLDYGKRRVPATPETRQIHSRRSPEVNFGRFLADRLSTPIWWRRAKFSSSRQACEQNIEDRNQRSEIRKAGNQGTEVDH
jgi:hypothetical protein